MSKTNKSNLWFEDFDKVFKMIFEQSFIGMAILDLNGIFLRVNPKACLIWEYKEQELLGKSWMDITYPEDIAKSTNYLQKYIDNPFSANIIEKRYVSGRNNIKHCRVTTSVILEKNTIKYFVTQIEDITGRVSAIKSIQKELLHLKAINKESEHKK